MSFICPVCDTTHKDRTCPTCTNKPVVCPACEKSYIHIRYYKNSDRLFIHEEHLVRNPKPIMILDDACYVKGDRS